ncbi:SWI/SNF complex subunit SWI3A isoform X1 [Rhododendron vialii]|uniref:SWI/SNF complex subunit SWI3A isoform X1 n=1 Tax=Rhododendron vialii TaxID=182163 RepID=UPI00265FA7D2|nr:SWI/SNF complex subunit SWI3A isoform X1 [Rhododendron vialii]
MESSSHPPQQDPFSLKPPLPADVDLYTIPSNSSWFSWNDIHDTERLHLREFFDGASITRTPKIYRDYRDFIISKYREDPSRRLSFTEVRKSLVGDVCLLRKVFLFLDKWGLINFGAPSAAAAAAAEGDLGRLKVRVEEGAPSGVRVVAGPNSLKPVGVPVPGPGGVGGDKGGGEVVGNGFKVLPPLASYRDVFSEENGGFCRGCKERCENGHYECAKEGSFIICVKCFKNGNYGENKSAGDFKFIDCIQNSGNHEAAWTEAETLLLLESVLKHGDDWDLVAENVKTKTKADCISKLIQLPFGDLMLGSAHRNGRLWENDGNLSVVKQGQVASSESHSEENVKREDQCEDVKNESNQNGDAENQVPPLKRKRTTPPSDTGNSLIQQVALLSSTVDPHITASAAEAAVTALCDEYQCTREIFDDDDNEIEELGSSPQNNKKERVLQVDGPEMEGNPTESDSQGTSTVKNAIPLTFQMRAATATALGAAAARAKLLADQEDREIECLVATIIETQMKKLQRKIKHFDELELIMEKEHTQLEDLKESLIAEHMNVLQRVFSSGISKWRDNTSVKPQLDIVL